MFNTTTAQQTAAAFLVGEETKGEARAADYMVVKMNLLRSLGCAAKLTALLINARKARAAARIAALPSVF